MDVPIYMRTGGKTEQSSGNVDGRGKAGQAGRRGGGGHWRGGKRRKEYKRIIHSKRWHTLRMAYIGSHPFCEECMARGIMDQPAEEVHHVRPIGTGRSWEEMCALALMLIICEASATTAMWRPIVGKGRRGRSRAGT